MKALFLKDLFVARKYLRTLAILMVFYVVLSVATQNVTLISGLSAMIAMLFLMTSFAYDESAKWDTYALSMPLSPGAVIGAKFLILAAAIVIGGFFSVLAIVLFHLLGITALSVDSFFAVAASLEIVLLLGFILMPILIRFGTERCRIIMICLVLIPVLASFALQYMDVSLSLEAIVPLLPALFALSPLILALLGVLSFLLSLRYYRAKEF